MRIRQVKPAFWTDPETGRWAADTQTLYMRLWGIADDVGWMEWDPDVIGALTYPYLSMTRRLALIRHHAAILLERGRLVIHECGCGFLPKLEEHQRVTGRKAAYALLKHQRDHSKQAVAISGYPVLIDKQSTRLVRGKGKGKGNEVRVRGTGTGTGTVARASAPGSEDPGETEFQRRVPRPDVLA